ncbi:tRNA(Ile)-lysidine synthase [Poriferisphaera corsica]|uniref:tRNA(Ile)-lysidine synthase n=1 Tax=Poriferisphaera corsica TaxID=2528020 RepID=A0A517YQR6_9BACT|nr:tRNA lysidine(34) synthetase TilS [Poriferisphaera corsica]QDU32551.1 tRNA(Ile)-lysidine synthase [Poriferisphaera corsica]
MDFKKRAKISYHPVVKAIARSLKAAEVIKPRGEVAVVVGVSGGADSVALLLGMHALSQRRGWGMRLVVGHVQHHLRGDEAEADALFVEDLAKHLGLAYERRDLDLREAKNIEEAARRGRYEALGEIAVQADCVWVATAHHADDQLETVLMRLLRGAGARGLRGVAKVRSLVEGVKIVRPLLGVGKEQIEKFLCETEQDWREDHTNADVERWRAKLRHEVLPVLKEIRGDAAIKAVQLGDRMRGLEGVLQDAVAEVIENDAREVDGVFHLPRDRARQCREIVLMGVLRSLAMLKGVDSDRCGERELGPITKSVRDQQGGMRQFELYGGVRVVVTRDSVLISNN